MTCQEETEFSAVVEGCVGIGRFAGAAVIAHTARKDEPVLFRRCYFLNLDWWGDAGGVYVRGNNSTQSEWVRSARTENCREKRPPTINFAG